jgi:hypothetical protein
MNLREQFAEAFDTYLDILRRLDHKIKVRLGRDAPTWRILHSCPACQYKVFFSHVPFDSYPSHWHQLEGEAELNPSVMGAMDGNNSLKRFVRDDRESDTLTFSSNYFIAKNYVNQFSNEVKRKVKKGDNQVSTP